MSMSEIRLKFSFSVRSEIGAKNQFKRSILRTEADVELLGSSFTYLQVPLKYILIGIFIKRDPHSDDIPLQITIPT